MPSPSEKQKIAIKYLMDSSTNYVGYGGAAFGGKSYLLCRWITTMALKYPGTGWGIGRKQLTTLMKTTVITLHKVFDEMGLKANSHYSYNGQLHVYTFTNGSQIFLIDMAYKPSDKLYTRFGGYELTGAAVDESVEVEEKAIEILFTRLGRRLNHQYGLKKKLLETFNPAKNHVYRRFWRPFRENELKDSYKFIPALPKDNPSPEVDEYINDILENASNETIQRLIYGNFDFEDDPNILIKYESRLDMFSNYHVIPNENWRYMTCDIALHGSDKFVIYVWFGWVVVDIVVRDKSGGMQIIDTIKNLMRKYKVPASQIIYDHDGVGAFIGGRGGFIPGAVPFIAQQRPVKLNEWDKDEKVEYKNFKAQCGFEIAKMINKKEIYIQFKVDNETEETIIEDVGEIKRDDYTKDGPLGLKRKTDIIRDLGRSPDYGDALLMRKAFDYIKIYRRRTKAI